MGKPEGIATASSASAASSCLDGGQTATKNGGKPMGGDDDVVVDLVEVAAPAACLGTAISEVKRLDSTKMGTAEFAVRRSTEASDSHDEAAPPNGDGDEEDASTNGGIGCGEGREDEGHIAEPSKGGDDCGGRCVLREQCETTATINNRWDGQSSGCDATAQQQQQQRPSLEGQGGGGLLYGAYGGGGTASVGPPPPGVGSNDGIGVLKSVGTSDSLASVETSTPSTASHTPLSSLSSSVCAKSRFFSSGMDERSPHFQALREVVETHSNNNNSNNNNNNNDMKGGDSILPPPPDLPATQPLVPVKMFVNRIPKDMKNEELRRHFEVFGTVLECNIIRDASGPKGCAFVKYASIEDAHRAILHLHGKKVLSHAAGPVQMKYANGEIERLGLSKGVQPGGECVKVFAGCLSRQCTSEMLYELFSSFGRVDEVFLLRDADSKKSKCSAFITYPERQMAERAIAALDKVHVIKIGKRPMEVRLAESKSAMNQSRRNAGGQAQAPRNGCSKTERGMDGKKEGGNDVNCSPPTAPRGGRREKTARNNAGVRSRGEATDGQQENVVGAWKVAVGRGFGRRSFDVVNGNGRADGPAKARQNKATRKTMMSSFGCNSSGVTRGASVVSAKPHKTSSEQSSVMCGMALPSSIMTPTWAEGQPPLQDYDQQGSFPVNALEEADPQIAAQKQTPAVKPPWSSNAETEVMNSPQSQDDGCGNGFGPAVATSAAAATRGQISSLPLASASPIYSLPGGAGPGCQAPPEGAAAPFLLLPTPPFNALPVGSLAPLYPALIGSGQRLDACQAANGCYAENGSAVEVGSPAMASTYSTVQQQPHSGSCEEGNGAQVPVPSEEPLQSPQCDDRSSNMGNGLVPSGTSPDSSSISLLCGPSKINEEAVCQPKERFLGSPSSSSESGAATCNCVGCAFGQQLSLWTAPFLGGNVFMPWSDLLWMSGGVQRPDLPFLGPPAGFVPACAAAAGAPPQENGDHMAPTTAGPLTPPTAFFPGLYGYVRSTAQSIEYTVPLHHPADVYGGAMAMMGAVVPNGSDRLTTLADSSVSITKERSLSLSGGALAPSDNTS